MQTFCLRDIAKNYSYFVLKIQNQFHNCILFGKYREKGCSTCLIFFFLVFLLNISLSLNMFWNFAIQIYLECFNLANCVPLPPNLFINRWNRLSWNKLILVYSSRPKRTHNTWQSCCGTESQERMLQVSSPHLRHL